MESPAAKSSVPRRPHRAPARRWVPYLGGIALVALIAFGLWPRPAVVETVKASIGPLRSTINEEGKTQIRQRYTISAPVAGQLRRIPLKAGAEVMSNDTVLAVIEPLAAPMLDPRTRALTEARRDTTRANLERARSAHEFAAIDLKRAQRLAKEKTISPQELDAVEWRETAAAKDLVAAESALRQAEAELMDSTALRQMKSPHDPIVLRSPVTGFVLRVFEENSRAVTAGTPLIEIGDPGDLEVVVEVLSRDGAAIAPGTRIELDHWGGSEPLEARVRFVEPAAFTKISALGVEEQRVNVRADLVTPREARKQLGDNFRVEARIIMWQTNATLKVPSGAVFRAQQRLAAFVVSDGRAHLQPLTTGRSSGAETEIVDGVKAGDELIIYPGDRIHDGMRVQSLKIAR